MCVSGLVSTSAQGSLPHPCPVLPLQTSPRPANSPPCTVCSQRHWAWSPGRRPGWGWRGLWLMPGRHVAPQRHVPPHPKALGGPCDALDGVSGKLQVGVVRKTSRIGADGGEGRVSAHVLAQVRRVSLSANKPLKRKIVPERGKTGELWVCWWALGASSRGQAWRPGNRRGPALSAPSARLFQGASAWDSSVHPQQRARPGKCPHRWHPGPCAGGGLEPQAPTLEVWLVTISAATQVLTSSALLKSCNRYLSWT